MKLTIDITGHSESDLETALEETLKKVREGYRAGFDSNDTGSYSFKREGDPVETYALVPAGQFGASESRFDRYEEAIAAAGKGDVVVGLSESGEIVAL